MLTKRSDWTRRRRAIRTLLVVWSVVGVVVFALATLTLNSTPVPPEFDGWAAIFVRDKPSTSRTFLNIVPLEPGGYGAHPRVAYNISACGRRPFVGLLMLQGDARLREPTSSPGNENSENRELTLLPQVTRLSIQDLSFDARLAASRLQVWRIRLPQMACRFPFQPESDAPPFVGTAAGVSGRLEGRLVRHSFAPLGLAPVRHTQSWPLLGQILGLGPQDLGAFRFGPPLQGEWARVPQSYYRLSVGSLDAKATVDFARPAPSNSEELSWTRSVAFTAKARVTNLDNLGLWQTIAVVGGIWLGIGGSILATLIYEATQRPVDAPPLAMASQAPVPARPISRRSWVGLAVLAFAIVRRRGKNR